MNSLKITPLQCLSTQNNSPKYQGPTSVAMEPKTIVDEIIQTSQLSRTNITSSFHAVYLLQAQNKIFLPVSDDELNEALRTQYVLYPARLCRLTRHYREYRCLYPLSPQSGKEKLFRRQQYQRSTKSKKKEKAKIIEKTKGKTWSPDIKRLHAKNAKRPYEPHAGLDDTLKNLRAQAEMMGKNLPADVWSKVEGAVLLASALFECQSQTQAASIFLLYLKTHYSEALTLTAYEYFQELFSEEESLEMEPHGAKEKPDWLNLLRDSMMNWRLVTSNPIFKKISYLISICITLGLCEASSFAWDVGKVRLFCIPALERHYGAFDMVDAAIETVLYFVEAGYACFSTNSLTPLLFSDIQAQEFEEEFRFLVQNLEHVKTGNLQKIVKIDENEYDSRLAKVMQEATAFHASAKGTWEKKVFFDRLAQLGKIRTTFDSIRVQGGLRVAPFTMNIFGKSGVGKSSVGSICMVMCLKANGFCAEDEFMATLNESDKYMSNYRSFINGIFLDDVGNTKPDFVEKSPTNKIIEICNNVRQYANMAEADLKGKVSIEPRVVVITTNVKNLCAHTYSNEPVSIARRAHLTLTVKVKPQFCSRGMAGSVGQQLDSAKVAAYYTNEDGLIDIPIVPDLWDLTVERVVPVPSDIDDEADRINYETCIFEDQELEDVDIHTFIRFMISQSRKYFVQQKMLVDQSNNLSEKIPMCSECNTPTDYCTCLPCDDDSESEDEELEPHGSVVGYMAGVALGNATNKVTQHLQNIWNREGTIIERETTKVLCKVADNFEKNFWYKWTNFVPRSWLTSGYGKQCVEYAMRDHILTRVKRDAFATLGLAGLCFAAAAKSNFWPLPVFLGMHVLYAGAVIVRTTKERVHREVLARSDAMPLVFKKVRDTRAKHVFAALGAVATLYTLLKVWQGFRSSVRNVQGNLSPTCAADIAERDAEENPWANLVVSDIPTTEQQRTCTAKQLTDKIHKNQVFLRIAQGTQNRICGGVFLKSGLLLMPRHMWYKDAKKTNAIEKELSVRITRSAHANTGSFFSAYFSEAYSYHIPDTDFVLVWVPNSGSYADITKYLPVDGVKSGICSMVFRNKDGQRVDANAHINVGMTGHSQCHFLGATYHLSIPTFKGLCMATFVTRSLAKVIAGFHLGGREGSTEGALGTVNQQQIQDAITSLGQRDGIVLPHSEGTMSTEAYGIQFVTSPEVSKKCPTRFLEEGTNMKVFGSALGNVTPHSSVVPTTISQHVADVCGIPQQWGPPKFRPTWKPWQESLKYSSKPSMGIEGELLSWAVKDYKKPLLEMVEKNEWIFKDIRKLTRMETVCGRDGCRFIDKMPPNTSVGYPLSGPKSDFLILLDPEQHPEHQSPAELDPMFWTEFESMKEKWIAGERAYPVFKGCLKDEPTKLTKDKVRVFQAAPIALQLAVRMYFLPIARFLSMQPILSECACGINAQGPEWNTLAEHLRKFGDDRIFAGDYSKYDLRMPAQIVFAAFSILIDIAKISGNYSEEDLCVMRGIATDIAYPCMAFNGTLLQLIGSNPSGQNLTVYINSVGNSLLNRCGFFSCMRTDFWYGKRIESGSITFRDAVALTTYGDDVKGSVKKGFDKYNHISFADFLAERDMKFTMPDKESEPTAYMKDSEADFLKRKNIWNNDVKMYFGALEEDSIFKSLHAVNKSKAITREEQSVANIDGAMREWFAHGRDVYEKRREQMREVASRAGLVCPETTVPYEERMTAWKVKYLSQEE